MEMEFVDAKPSPDRFSTIDEIRAALSFLPDAFLESAKENLWEVASDLGGRVLLDSEDMENDEILTVLERLNPTAN